ncbi:MoaD/ThiS family protein [Natrinema amylolyticum]|uniref:MoaD/ThiS family protein n=1 Tax=Natrinema amylolyticum TaxID=2878679 RepID=UPI001CF9A08A|nr:MoaD/ThiS family protein [Natrinema amylolyticum]
METAVTVYGPLRSATGGKTVTLEWAGGTVADALAAIVEAYPRAEPHLFDGDAVRSSVRVSIDGERAGLERAVPDDASLTVVPAVQGGAAEKWPA